MNPDTYMQDLIGYLVSSLDLFLGHCFWWLYSGVLHSASACKSPHAPCITYTTRGPSKTWQRLPPSRATLKWYRGVWLHHTLFNLKPNRQYSDTKWYCPCLLYVFPSCLWWFFSMCMTKFCIHTYVVILIRSEQSHPFCTVWNYVDCMDLSWHCEGIRN